MRHTTRLRQLFERKRLFVLGGGANAFEARMLEAAGFEAAYMSGSGTAMYLTGYPDVGLTTMTEMVLNAGYMARAVNVPLVSDADTGYGGPLNVRRTVQEFARAGVAGIHIEDQVFPKRCGFLAGKDVVPMEEAVAKVRAAVDARNELDPDFIIIARTDVLGSPGGTLAEVVRRCKAYRAAGSDVSFVEGVKSVEEVRACAEEVGPPLMLIPSGLREAPSHQELERLGVTCVLYPSLARAMGYQVNWEYLHDVREHGTEAVRRWRQWQADFPWRYPQPPDQFTLLGLPQILEVERRYMDAAEVERRYT